MTLEDEAKHKDWDGEDALQVPSRHGEFASTLFWIVVIVLVIWWVRG